MLVHPGVWQRAARDAAASPGGPGYDFLPGLAALRPVVSGADLAICHLEVPLGEAGAEPRGFPLFSAPPEVADALGRMGYDSCSTASNHAIDRGADGAARTLAALDAAGVRHAGTARDAGEGSAPTLLELPDVAVAHLSYTYGHNNVRPADKPWLVNTLADGSIAADARAARAAGAAVVIVSIHWGAEYVTTPTSEQRTLAAELMAGEDVDLVVGHHAHVVQPIEQFGDRFVVYGMGNSISALSHDFAGGASREGIVPVFTFSAGADGRWRVTDIEVTPTYVSGVGGLHASDVAADLADPPLGEDVARLRRARARTVAAVFALGADPDIVRVR